LNINGVFRSLYEVVDIETKYYATEIYIKSEIYSLSYDKKKEISEGGCINFYNNEC